MMQLEVMVLGVDGRKIEVIVRRETTDTSLVGQIFVDGAFDLRRLKRVAELQEFISSVRASGRRPLIVDAGANIGLTSVYFSIQCPDAMVVAIEPAPGNFAVLQHNVKCHPVVALPCALACEAKRLELYDPGDGDWAFQTRAGSDTSAGLAVDSISINEIYEAYDDQAVPFIVKIDIEGGENDVFSRNLDWIDNTPLIIVELHDWMLPKKSTSQTFLQAISGRDRDFLHFGENIFSISNNFDRPLSRGSSGRQP